MREHLASRLGFIFLSAGCAIGLGNVWRFPYIVGQNGGGWFVAIYLFFLLIIGWPVLVMEFAAGRAAQRSIARMHAELTPTKPWWRVHGWAGFLGNVLLMMFYTTVTGWMLIYFAKSVAGGFVGLAPDAIAAEFGATIGNAKIQIVAMLMVTWGAAGVCALGLQKGLERVTKVMMGGLLLLIVALAVNSLTLQGAGRGLEFYLVPDLGRMRSIGVTKVIVEAMNHAFFTLSLGIGAMSIFGSYINRDRTLVGEATNVCLLDTFVAITAGLVIIPACFAFNLEPGQGPGLVFVTLPNVFNQMAGGRFWGALFFLFMSTAALTTVLAVFENILACLCDYADITRQRAALILALVIPILSLPCIWGFNWWSGFHPLGAGSGVLDLEDFVVSNLLLPLGALAYVIYSAHRAGWGWQNFLNEANAGAGPKLSENHRSPFRFYCAYCLPLIMVAILILGLIDKFK